MAVSAGGSNATIGNTGKALQMQPSSQRLSSFWTYRREANRTSSSGSTKIPNGGTKTKDCEQRRQLDATENCHGLWL